MQQNLLEEITVDCNLDSFEHYALTLKTWPTDFKVAPGLALGFTMLIFCGSGYEDLETVKDFLLIVFRGVFDEAWKKINLLLVHSA